MFNDKGVLDYLGAIFSGAISGMAGNIATAILFCGIASVIDDAFEGELTDKNLIISFIGGALGGLIGFGIGEIVKYGVSFIQAGAGKLLSKFVSNNKINRFFTRLGASSVKVGENSIKEITKGLANSEKNYYAQVISPLVSGWI